MSGKEPPLFVDQKSESTPNSFLEAVLLKGEAMNYTIEAITISDMTEKGEPLVYVNDVFVILTGYERHQAVGKNCRFLQGPETDPVAVEKIREAINKGLPCVVELLNYRQDGIKFWNRLSLAPLHALPYARPTHYVGVQTDITSKVSVELKARELADQIESYLKTQQAKAAANPELKEMQKKLEALQESVAELRANNNTLSEVITHLV